MVLRRAWLLGARIVGQQEVPPALDKKRGGAGAILPGACSALYDGPADPEATDAWELEPTADLRGVGCLRGTTAGPPPRAMVGNGPRDLSARVARRVKLGARPG